MAGSSRSSLKGKERMRIEDEPGPPPVPSSSPDLQESDSPIELVNSDDFFVVGNIRPGSHVPEDEDEDAGRRYPHPGIWWDPAKMSSWDFRQESWSDDAFGSRAGPSTLTPCSVLFGREGAASPERQSRFLEHGIARSSDAHPLPHPQIGQEAELSHCHKTSSSDQRRSFASIFRLFHKMSDLMIHRDPQETLLKEEAKSLVSVSSVRTHSQSSSSSTKLNASDSGLDAIDPDALTYDNGIQRPPSPLPMINTPAGQAFLAREFGFRNLLANASSSGSSTSSSTEATFTDRNPAERSRPGENRKTPRRSALAVGRHDDDSSIYKRTWKQIPRDFLAASLGFPNYYNEPQSAQSRIIELTVLFGTHEWQQDELADGTYTKLQRELIQLKRDSPMNPQNILEALADSRAEEARKQVREAAERKRQKARELELEKILTAIGEKQRLVIEAEMAEVEACRQRHLELQAANPHVPPEFLSHEGSDMRTWRIPTPESMRNLPQPRIEMREQQFIDQKDMERTEAEAAGREIREVEEAWLERRARRLAEVPAESRSGSDYTPSVGDREPASD